ncbi:hypothetical protein GCM10007301_47970 [Azorhizobium oxalatiphilum]|uniref:Uncharacterized protein n=1 Tax=Azorhizobium oxalatiphilum TaxID=980631 RepID=A0A917CBH9_9HYPH|nr:hypothetical protein [Azorhizobium oxalatiphilum]GGF82274.1 hypothetical protein GCM10007301_47970 [Azorhizobium oxalatiphilum]
MANKRTRATTTLQVIEPLALSDVYAMHIVSVTALGPHMSRVAFGVEVDTFGERVVEVVARLILPNELVPKFEVANAPEKLRFDIFEMTAQ